MTFVERFLADANGTGKDDTRLDSETLLWEYVAACESCDKVRLELENQVFALTKEFAPADRSEAAMEMAGRILDLFHEADMLLKRITAITREVVTRISRYAVNRYFGLLKISDLQGDFELQKEALRNLYNLFASIPGKRGWFHNEKRDGVKGIADLLLAKELEKYRNLDLRSTLEHMMDNRFAYLYCAYERDFIDEMKKARCRPFETMLDPDMLDEGRAELPESEGSEADLTDRIHRRELAIRLREAGRGLDHPVDQEIIHHSADLLDFCDCLNRSDRVIRAELVNQVSDERHVTKQLVRRRIIEGASLPTLKRILNTVDGSGPTDGFRVVLTDDEGEK